MQIFPFVIEFLFILQDLLFVLTYEPGTFSMFFDFEAVDFNGKLISNIYQHRQKRIRVKKYPNKMKRGRKNKHIGRCI